jgi:hypothetical protein
MKKLVLRFGVGFAAVGGLLTLFMMLTITSEFGWDQHGTAAAIRFNVGMMLVAPSITIGRALGVQEGINAWLWTTLAVVPNTIFCFAAGALTGMLAHLLRRGISKQHETPS